MTEIDALKKKHSQLLITVKIKELQYAVDFLRFQNQRLQMLYKQSEKKLKLKTQQAKHMSSEFHKLKRTYYLHFMSFKQSNQIVNKKPQKQNILPKTRSSFSSKRVNTTVSTIQQNTTIISQRSSFSIQWLEERHKLEQKYRKYFGNNNELKQPLLGFISKTYKISQQQQLLSNCDDLFQQLSTYSQRKSAQINQLIKGMIREVQDLSFSDKQQEE